MRALIILLLSLFTVFAKGALAACQPGQPDEWSADQKAAWPFQPYDCMVLETGNVAFSWPAETPVQPHVLHLSGPHGSARINVKGSWYFRISPLPAGTYAWHVERADGSLSRSRQFTVPANARSRELPGIDQAGSRAKARARPRSLPEGSQLVRLHEALRTDRAAAFTSLTYKVIRSANLPLPDLSAVFVPSGPITSQKAAGLAELRKRSQQLQGALTEKAHMAYLHADSALARQAISDLVAVAAWSPEGVASHRAHDQANRSVAWTLAVGYDLLAPWMNDSERRAVRQAAIARAGQIAADLLEPWSRLEARPYDSHGWTNFHFLAAIAALFAGESQEADRWFAGTFPLLLAHGSAWNSPDGGYANGGYYLSVSFALLMSLWDAISNASGIDLYRSEWMHAGAESLPHLFPPGSIRTAFGDGAEIPPSPWLAHALSMRVDSALLAWYAQQVGMQGVAPSLPLLLAPPAAGQAGGRFVVDATNRYGRVFKSSGVVAMHQDLGRRDGHTILFRAGGPGSFNHNHADQNSFVIHKGALPVFIDSGQYDFYGSRHWAQWYKRTRAHNAVTYDGGSGQVADVIGARAYLVETAGRTLRDVVGAEAAPAYGAPVTGAWRSLVYLRDRNAVLVRDRLAVQRPVAWEWNLHTLWRMSANRAGGALMTLPDSTVVCVRQLFGPPMAWREVTDETRPVNGSQPAEYHWQWKPAGLLQAADIGFVIELSCRPDALAPVAVRRQPDGRIDVDVAGHTVHLP